MENNIFHLGVGLFVTIVGTESVSLAFQSIKGNMAMVVINAVSVYRAK